MPHFMTILIPYIILVDLSWIIKCLFLRNMEPLRAIAVLFAFSGDKVMESVFPFECLF